MNLYIDDGNTEKIKKLYKIGIFSGVSTNPSIIRKAERPPLEVINEILEITDGDLFVQATSDNYDDLIKEGKEINKINPERIIIKIPFSGYGLAAAKELEKNSCRTLVTAIYSYEQAVLSIESGTEYIAPYVNRMENAGIPIEHVKMIQEYIEVNKKNCEIVAASFKNLEQIRTVINYGVDNITISTDLYSSILENELVKNAIVNFDKDWKSIKNKKWVI
jgi:TalC/MipB family fructose-6-phosphate aldolase